MLLFLILFMILLCLGTEYLSRTESNSTRHW